MIRAAIVEDDAVCAQTLNNHIERFSGEHGIDISVSVFSGGFDFLSGEQSFDVVFLDIALPGMNGMEIARQLRRRDPEVIIIFVTQLAQFARDGYEVGALDYLIKPVSYRLFEIKFSTAARLIREKEASYMISVKDGLVRVAVSDIYYVESQKHYMVFHTVNGEYTTRVTMKTVESYLSSHHFARPNNSYLINLRWVDAVNGSSVTVRGAELSVSRSFKTSFMEELTRYLGGRVIRD